MAIKNISISSMKSPAARKIAESIDKKLGNADGKISTTELKAYQKANPEKETGYDLVKKELDAAAVTGEDKVKTTSKQKEEAVAVSKGQGVIGFRIQEKSGAKAKAAPVDAGGSTGVEQSLPLDQLTKIGASAAGAVYQLDSHSVATMNVRVRQIEHPSSGRGTELAFRLTPDDSLKLAALFGSGGVKGSSTQPFKIEQATVKNGVTVLDEKNIYQPSINYSNKLSAFTVESAGKFTLEYIPPTDNPQAYRDKIRLRVYGKNDAERKANLEAALQAIKSPGLVADADTTQQARLAGLSMLRMVDPKKAEELASSLDSVSLKTIQSALKAAGINDQRLAGANIQEVFPGTMAVVDPALGEAYAKLGVKGIMVGVGQIDSAAKVLASDGLMSSVERYGRGIHKQGASLSSDETSGGAEYAFTRLVTPRAVKDKTSIASSYGAGQVQLLCVGDEMKAQLSRTDWHAYATDNFGVTVSIRQTKPPLGDQLSKNTFNQYTAKFSERPVLGELVKQVNGDSKAPGSYSSGFQHGNEACFKSGVPAKAFTYAVVASEQNKKALIAALKKEGINQLGGKKLEQAILVGSDWAAIGQQLGW